MAKITKDNTKEINQLGKDVAVILTKVEYIKSDVTEIKDTLSCVVMNDDEYKDLKKKIHTMWDERNRVIGWLLACGIVGGTTGAFIKQLVSGVFAK